MRHVAHCVLSILLLTSTAHAQEVEPPRARVSNLQISRLDDASQRAIRQLPSGTTGVTCSFDVTSVPRGSGIELHWFRGDEELTTSEFNAVEGSSSLSSQLESDTALDAGEYRAEVWIDDVPEGRISFTIEAARAPQQRARERLAPSISELIVATSECGSDTTPPGDDTRSFSGFVESVSLCLQYEHMLPSRPLEIRWYDDASPRRPMTVSTFTPDGSGELEAWYLSDGPMAPGSYHVVVALGDRALERAAFVVEP